MSLYNTFSNKNKKYHPKHINKKNPRIFMHIFVICTDLGGIMRLKFVFQVYVNDQFLNWDPEYRLKVRIVSARAYHSLFMHNM